jgi:phosphohistidine phosphatase
VRLYLIRHGKAVSADLGVGDGERPLAPEGRMGMARVARRLNVLGVRWRLILTSPLVRARETAEILRKAGLAPSVEEVGELAPGGGFAAWLPFLAGWHAEKCGDLAVVGHLPSLALWAESLVWGEERQRFVLKAGGIIGLELPDGGPLLGTCSLFWLTSPKLLP